MVKLYCRFGVLLSFDIKLLEIAEVRIESDEGVFLILVTLSLGAYLKLDAYEFFRFECGFTVCGERRDDR